MTARATLALAKPIAAGAGVSYGHTWVADRDTTVGLVPVGYGDGVPRHAGNRGRGLGRRRAGAPIRGRVCMDQFVVDLDGDLPAPGTDVVLFGAGARRRAHRAGLGRGLRHHQLRDRDPDRRPDGPPPRATRRTPQ